MIPAERLAAKRVGQRHSNPGPTLRRRRQRAASGESRLRPRHHRHRGQGVTELIDHLIANDLADLPKWPVAHNPTSMDRH